MRERRTFVLIFTLVAGCLLAIGMWGSCTGSKLTGDMAPGAEKAAEDPADEASAEP